MTGATRSKHLLNQDFWVGPGTERQRYLVRPDAAKTAFIERAPAEYRRLLEAGGSTPKRNLPAGPHGAEAKEQTLKSLEDRVVELTRERDELFVELARLRQANDGIAASLAGLSEVLRAEGSNVRLHE
jgi:hypothetical protein